MPCTISAAPRPLTSATEPASRLTPCTPEVGRPVRGFIGEYTGTSNGQKYAAKQIAVVVEYDLHYVGLFYAGPEPLFDKYFPVYNMVGTLLKERER